ncbi:MAG: penicillin-binding protein 2 [Marinilabiliaceae bacterium]|nr:penicillin-binding protein 2 [Marinilabiliaceae bacterium]
MIGSYNNRALTISVMVVLLGLIFIIKLFFIQVHDETYKLSADSNTQRILTQYPARGLIFDRNGKLLVSNQPVYDIMIVPRDVEPFDTLDFCKSLNIQMDDLRKMFVDLRKSIRSRKVSSYKPSAFIKQVSAEQYGVFQEKEYKFKGFFAQRRTLRKYEYPGAAHVMGYVGEVNEAGIKKDPYYVMGDYIGISGIENTYESYLRGRKGAKVVMVDVHGREKGAYRDGRFDTAAIVGKNLTLSLDIDLQMYGELLMQNKIGSVVAIEPATGEILAMVSAPSYDPGLLVGRVRSQNYTLLEGDPNKPLFIRPLQAQYPPGSTFKTLNALIALQEGVITEDTRIPCSMGYHLGSLKVGCHAHPSPLNLPQSIQHSCNAYYSAAFRKILDNPKYNSPKEGLEHWKDYCVKFGLGYRLETDFAYEKRGFIPNAEYYNKAYRGSWNSVTVISLGIGQAELLLTPIQTANMTTAICNRGYYYTPHVVKSIEDEDIDPRFKEKHFTGIDERHFTPVLDGMERAVWGDDGGTARIAQIDSIRLCGKTGTAQNPHGKDHSIFIAFAPRENPKIAIAVYVENAGFGATYAAPVASLMIEKYLNGQVSEKRKFLEERMVNANLIGNAVAQ